MNDLEEQELELQNEIDGLVAASRIPITKAHLISWIKNFEKGTPADKAFQKRVIDVLINSVYIYDNRFIVYFNADSTELVSFFEATDDAENVETWESFENDETALTQKSESGVRICNYLAE